MLDLFPAILIFYCLFQLMNSCAWDLDYAVRLLPAAAEGGGKGVRGLNEVL